jgi:hypothetical protein
MSHLLGAGTDRGYSMIGLGIGLGLSGFRLPMVGFNPAKISGLKAWWDATDAATLYQTSGGSLATADGDPVGEWRDKSGNGYHWAQASGINRPALKTGIKNLKNTVRFDGVNDNMTISGSNSSLKLLHSANNTIFLVLSASSLAANRTIFDSAAATTAGIGSFLNINTSGALGQQCYNASGTAPGSVFVHASSSSYIAAGSWYVLSIVSTPAEATVANRSTFYKNTGSAQNNNTSTGALSTANSSQNLMLGGFQTGGGQPFVGDFAEFIIYDSALSAGDRALVESYLNNKWGVY